MYCAVELGLGGFESLGLLAACSAFFFSLRARVEKEAAREDDDEAEDNGPLCGRERVGCGGPGFHRTLDAEHGVTI